MNLIKQITIGDGSMQTIKMVVRSNERGPQGLRGEEGEAATLEAGNVYSIPEGQNPQVINTGTSSNAVFDFYLPKGPKGDDGAIHYTAGTGINITEGNVIEATGAATAAWGGIQGNIEDQTDLKEAIQDATDAAEESSKDYTDTQLEGYAKTTDIPTVNNATLTIQNNGTNVATFTANSSTNTTANIVPPVQIGSVLSTPTDVAYVNTSNIVNGAVTTSKIANGAVTASNIDWSDIPQRVGTDDNYALKYPDGTMICCQRISCTMGTVGQWGSLYNATLSPNNVNYAVEFYTAPTISVDFESSSLNGMIINRVQGGSPTKTHSGSHDIIRPSTFSTDGTVIINVIAIGRWKA